MLLTTINEISLIFPRELIIIILQIKFQIQLCKNEDFGQTNRFDDFGQEENYNTNKVRSGVGFKMLIKAHKFLYDSQT
jgi:hypothetical protein